MSRPRFIVVVRDGLASRAFGPYPTFRAADGDARAWNGFVLPLEPRDAPEPWDARHHERTPKTQEPQI